MSAGRGNPRCWKPTKARRRASSAPSPARCPAAHKGPVRQAPPVWINNVRSFAANSPSILARPGRQRTLTRISGMGRVRARHDAESRSSHAMFKNRGVDCSRSSFRHSRSGELSMISDGGHLYGTSVRAGSRSAGPAPLSPYFPPPRCFRNTPCPTMRPFARSPTLIRPWRRSWCSTTA